MPKSTRLPDVLPLYEDGVHVRNVEKGEYEGMLETGEWISKGTRRTAFALHVQRPDDRDLKADRVPKGRSMAYKQSVGDGCRVWQHDRTSQFWPNGAIA